MISQRGINNTPNFILPRRAVKSSRATDYPLGDIRTIQDSGSEIPTFYKKLAVSVTAIFLGAMVGIATPWLTQVLERLF